MITDAQEAALAARRAQTAQDKRNPFLIHVDDGRLIPNVARLRGHAKYRVFTGSPKATPEERMVWLRSMGNGTPLPTMRRWAGLGKFTRMSYYCSLWATPGSRDCARFAHHRPR